MSQYVEGPKFIFTFSPENYKRQNYKVPPVTFTCQALASDTLAPHLKLCSKFLSYLQNRRDTLAFHYPVPESTPEYYKIIKHPMDFSTVGRKIFDQEYGDMEAFKRDVDLIWSNCITYNQVNSPLGRKALQLKSAFDELWDLHISIDDIQEPMDCIELMNEASRITHDEFNPSHTSMQIFRMPPHLKIKPAQPDRASRPIKSERDHDDGSFLNYPLPSESQLNNPMTTKEKYELAVAIDTMPPELLGEVIELLSKATEIKRDADTNIPFSALDNPTLRTIEAYVKHAKEKEQAVRRMFQSETIPAEKQVETLKAEVERVDDLLKQKKALISSSEFTSENETTDDTSGDTDSTGAEDSSTSSSDDDSTSETGDDI